MEREKYYDTIVISEEYPRILTDDDIYVSFGISSNITRLRLNMHGEKNKQIDTTGHITDWKQVESTKEGMRKFVDNSPEVADLPDEEKIHKYIKKDELTTPSSFISDYIDEKNRNYIKIAAPIAAAIAAGGLTAYLFVRRRIHNKRQ